MAAAHEIYEAMTIEGSADKQGLEWDVVLIQGGFNSSKSRYYTKEALRSIAELADKHGLQAMADHLSMSEARDKPEGSILKVVGWYDNVRFDEANNRVVGRLHLLSEGSPFPHLPKAMKEAFDRGNPSLYELSIRGSAENPKIGTVEGMKTTIIGPLNRLASTDLVTKGGAGGKFLNILASDRRDSMIEGLKDMNTEELVEALKETHPSLAEALTATATQEVTEETETVESNEDVIAEARRVVEDVRRERWVAQAERTVAEEAKGLPSGVRSRLVNQAREGRISTPEALTEAINEEKAIYSELTTSGPTMGEREFNVAGGAKAGTAPDSQSVWEGIVAMLKGDKVYNGTRAFHSLREAYYNFKLSQGLQISPWGGASMADAIVREATAQTYDPLVLDPGLNEALAGDEFKIQEAVDSGTFTVILGTAMHKVFLDDYRNLAAKFNDHEKLISDPVTVNDFKPHNFTRRGVYNSLPKVNEGGTYQPLVTPGEEVVVVAVAKFGGTETLTIESIANDDLNALRAIPRDMATGAVIGRYRAIFDMFLANSGNGVTMDYDNKALFHADHGNRGTTALSVSSLHTAWERMLKNTALSASEATLFTKPRYVVVPPELMMLSWQLFNGSFQIDAPHTGMNAASGTLSVNNPNPVKGLVEPIVVPYWTDNNNWYLVADPSEMHTIVYARLEGHEEPQLLMQDNPTVGSVFTADKITFRVRDVRDQDVLDHRAFFGAVV
jgi:hypothetical protein